MITGFDIVYYSIYLLCLLASLRASSKTLPGLLFLQMILIFGLVTEGMVEVLQYYKANENFPYYIYIPLEYILLCFFFRANTNKPFLRKLLMYSVVPYLLFSIFLSVFKYNFASFPAYVYNANCFLSIIWLVIMLLNLEIVNNLTPVRIPAFWVFTSFLVFYAGIFFFNGAYNYFLKKDPTIADHLRNYVNTGLNYVLYSVLTYAFICSANMKKY